jgi:hypothetical protein
MKSRESGGCSLATQGAFDCLGDDIEPLCGLTEAAGLLGRV